jgi:hypothetical protein
LSVTAELEVRLFDGAAKYGAIWTPNQRLDGFEVTAILDRKLRKHVKEAGSAARDLGCRLISKFAEAQPQKGDDCSLFGTHALDFCSQLEVGLFCQNGEQGFVEVTFENLWMDIASATDRGCVAGMFGARSTARTTARLRMASLSK